jgi:DNA binding domain, excisionase family
MAYMTTGEAARLLGVGLNTIKRWIANGALEGVRTPGGHWRIPESALREWMRTHGVRVRDGGDRLRILILDDDPAACELLAAVIEQSGLPCESRCVHNGYSGLIQMGAWRPDVLVLDILMPGINGIDVLHRLHEDAGLVANMIVMVVTGAFNQTGLMQAVRKAGADAVLPKPVDTRLFLAVLGGCLQKKKPEFLSVHSGNAS